MAFINKNVVRTRLQDEFQFTPTASQSDAMDKMAELITSSESMPTLLLRGYAGTGKTALMRAFCNVADELHFPLTLMAPTGRAAKVLTAATGRTARTIHKVIYRQESATHPENGFNVGYNTDQQGIFVVDEASMISDSYGGDTEFGSGRLLTDLISFIFSRQGCRLLLIGDPAQLPPVGLNQAPALDPKTLESFGLSLSQAWLSEIVRQEESSEILTNASSLRWIIENDPTFTGLPRLEARQGTDVERISGADLIETLITCYDRYGTGNTLVVTRSNKRATRFNLGIRGSVMFKEEELTRGDLLMVSKNNYLWLGQGTRDFIANGDIAEVVRINGYQTMHNRRFANVSIRLLEHNDVDIDARLMLDELASESARIAREDECALLESVMADYADLGSQRKIWDAVRKDQYFNALQVKFAYAVTCHKAQGGQWDAVFVDIGFVPDEQKNTELLKWLYTAFTRATKKLYLVNFPDECFE